MARPLRIEFAGALYHVTSRGNARADIFSDDFDRYQFLKLLGEAGKRFGWLCHAYCLMSNHYHLLIETGQPGLSKGMRFLNGVYAQRYNKRHTRVGHLFQGRFKGILVESDAYFLELVRYIVLNPVRARMVRQSQEWPWSSYRATAGLARPEPCLTIDRVLAEFSERCDSARSKYQEFVNTDQNQPSPWENLKNQIYLGSDSFVQEMLNHIEPDKVSKDIPKPQTLDPSKPLNYYESAFTTRQSAMAAAYRSGHYTMVEVAEYFGVSRTTVGRALKEYISGVHCAT